MAYLIQITVDALVVFATEILLPLMAFGFVVAVITRILIFHTIKRQEWFSKEFEKRVNRTLETHSSLHGPISFYILTKKTLEKTFYEIFKSRAILKRRNPDTVMELSDRLFLITHGVAWLIRDTLKRIKYLNRKEHKPNLLQISKNIFQTNPCFNRLFGVFPSSGLNEILGVLPGMFIIGGIFGTFLGIMKALPELGGMDLADAEQTKFVMDNFLLKISFAMSTSIVGIMLSVLMNVVNSFLSPERVFVETVDRFENSLDILWNLSDNNELPVDTKFDEHRDPLEALAEAAVQEELDKKKRPREGYETKSEPSPKDKETKVA